MVQPVPPDTLGFILSDTARLMRAAVEEILGSLGLGITPGEARALMHISALGLARQMAIAERMGIEPMTLSGYVDRLEARGFVRRLADPGDRRAKLVKLTGDGEAMVETMRPLTRRLAEEVTAPLGEGGGERLREMLPVLRSALQERRDG